MKTLSTMVLIFILATLNLSAKHYPPNPNVIAVYHLDKLFNVTLDIESARFIKEISLTDKNYYMVRIYSRDGDLKMVGHSEDPYGDIRTGPHTFYFDSGQLESEGEYRLNIKVGLWKRYYNDGSEREAHFYSESRWQKLINLKYE